MLLCLVNMQSVRNKTDLLVDCILENNLDICVVTESWTKPDDQVVLGEITPPGYKLFCNHRSGRSGGGIVTICKEQLHATCVSTGQKDSFEYMELSFSSGAERSKSLSIYRPPYSAAHPVSSSVFFEQFGEMMESFNLSTERILIAGDFNFHVDVELDRDAKTFQSLLNSLNLQQHVTCPTHRSGHTLDLIISRATDVLVISPPVADSQLSDHSSVICKIALVVPPPTERQIIYRQLRKIDLEDFKNDLKHSLNAMNTTDPDQLALALHQTSRSILDKHVPEIERKLHVRAKCPWFNKTLLTAKRHKRACERRWRRTHLQSHFEIFTAACANYRTLILSSKAKYYQELVSANRQKPKELFSIIHSLLHKKKTQPLPEHVSMKELANRFSEFFLGKIRDIRLKLDISYVRNISVANFSIKNVPVWSSFEPVSPEMVSEFVRKSPTKSCLLDSLPTQLFKECLDILSPSVTEIVNSSFINGVFPNSYKNAIITPLLKKSGLDTNLKNYRPISNLPFISKLIERIVVNQLQNHLSCHHLNEPFQSAYRQYHSTETALKKSVMTFYFPFIVTSLSF